MRRKCRKRKIYAQNDMKKDDVDEEEEEQINLNIQAKFAGF